MARVRVFEAATEGFRLIRREPKAVLAWSGLVYLCLGLPVSLLFQSVAHDIDAGPEAQLSGLSVLGLALSPLVWIAGIIALIALVGAVLRSVLTPEDRRFLYLRLSKAELWMTLSALVGVVILWIGLMIAMMAVIFATTVPLALLSSGGGGEFSPVHWGIVLTFIPLYVAMIYLAARFGMGLIISFDERRFALFDSWSLTSGQGWRLVGLWLLLMLFVWLVEWAFMLLIFGGALPGLFQSAPDPAAEAALADRILSLGASRTFWLIGLAGCALAGPFLAVLHAPWARAYQMLRETTPAEA